MKARDRVKISQCMIVKNEEKNIRQALSWGKEVVSEQIVVDTGSTDRTVEIAEQMGAKVYHFSWIDDFAAAKNYAIEQAIGEWIIFLDADEYFQPEAAQKLKFYVKSLHSTRFHALLTGRVNIDNLGNVMAINTQCRVFRNHPNLRYKRRIHEYLASMDGSPMQMADAVDELSMYHTGYGEEETKNKSGRNLKLIQMELTEDPDDFEMWGYLGQEYEEREMWEEADHAFRKAVELMPKSQRGHYDVSTSITLLRLLEVQVCRPNPNIQDILKVYEQATEGWPEEADYDYTMAKYFTRCGNFEEGETYLRRALDILNTYGSTVRSMILCGEIRKAYELLAICCYNNGNMADCVKFTTTLLKEDAHLMSTLTVLLRAFKADEETAKKGRDGIESVLVFLGGSFYDFGQLKDRLFVLRAAMAAEYWGMVQRIRETFAPEELAAVDKALGQGGKG